MQQRQRRRRQQDEIPGPAVSDGHAAERGRIDDDPGGEAAPRFVFAAEIDHHEMQRERAHREIEPAQPQRRQAEDDSEQRADQRRRRQRDPERRLGLLEQDADRESAGRHQPGMSERDLSGIAGEQHQRQRADRGKEDLRREIELERRGDERKREQCEDEGNEAHALEPRSNEREILPIAGAEVAAGARLPRHDRAPRGCRTGPRGARSAWRSSPGTAPRRTAVDRCSGWRAPRRRRR